MERPNIEWQALEYEHREKDSNWYWAVGALGGVLAILALVFANLLVAILAVVGTCAVLLQGARPPAMVAYGLTGKGVRVGERLYPYDHLKSFWVSDEVEHKSKKIIIESHKLVPHIILPLPAEIPGESARVYLRDKLAEVRHEDTLADALGDVLGF